MSQLGLVLSGGGARGAYQAGVLAALSHIASKLKIPDPFKIYTGVSAGAINVGLLVAHPGNFVESSKELTGLWSHIDSDQVFYADLMALSRGGLQWMTEISLGGFRKDQALRSLLSTHPLHSFLSEKCHFPEIEKKIKQGHLRSVGISALDYDSISTVTFFQGAPDIEPWERGMHRSERAVLGVEHIMASSAIPLLFPPIKIGERYFGDGCIRNQSPCGPAIYMGADHLIAIGVRRKQDTSFTYHHRESGEVPTVSKVANVLMNAVMMDGLESDIQRIEQINQSYSLLTPQERKRVALREVKSLWISPSVDFSEIAAKKSGELPRMIRYLLRGPGSLEESSEMLSYLLFTPTYCKQLIEIGFADGMKERPQIEQILAEYEENHHVKHHAHAARNNVRSLR
ncbi:patatin-like phospholipase family protein [Bdellovibrio sp. BCCA]|uniref:patatin-like phospholipase family protein n=1 Tax=Bdellovibrio sp. BCCA TaxID=3136281 RepID=UPI0030F2D882